MKWFKHHSDLQRDEGVSAYLDLFDSKDRLTAYGFFMVILEIIAERMTPEIGDPKCSATFSKREWSRLTNCHTNRVDKYLSNLWVIGWVSVMYEDSSCTIEIPKLLEWRDEFSRKKARSPDKVAQIRPDQNTKQKKEIRLEDTDDPPFGNKTLTKSVNNLVKVNQHNVTRNMSSEEWEAKKEKIKGHMEKLGNDPTKLHRLAGQSLGLTEKQIAACIKQIKDEE